MSSYLWTSESVSPGHPDKIADQISDTVLDAYLSADPQAKVASETLVKDSTVIIAGEITSTVDVPREELEAKVRACITGIGYNDDMLGYNGANCTIQFLVSQQSREINRAVDTSRGIAAGDQGIMFGYATRETPNHMPLAIYLAKEFINEAYERVRQHQSLRPDMKSQVSLVYENGRATRIDSIVFSSCHAESLSIKQVRELIQEEVINATMARQPEHIAALFSNTKLHINPAGTWNIGGPVADCGLTGRKIVVDQYGADCEIGGGAFSGKDPSKVDRSAAYMARHLALRALSEHPSITTAKVQLAYAIGVAEPVSVRIYDPSTMTELTLDGLSPSQLTPSAIIEHLHLSTPIYAATARYGHFGVPPKTERGLVYHPWEE